LRGWGEGKEEDPEEESPRSYIDYFILFLAKIIFCRWDDRGLRSQSVSLQNLFLPKADFSLSSTSPHFLTSPPKNQPKKLLPSSLPILSSPAAFRLLLSPLPLPIFSK